MAVFRHRDKWKAQVWVNQRRVASKSGFRTKKDAERWHNEKAHAFAEGGLPMISPEEKTFDDLVEKYRETRLETMGKSTRDRYLVDIEGRIKPFFRFMKLSRITPLMIEEFRAKVIGEGLEPKSVNNATDTLRNMLNYTLFSQIQMHKI